MVDGEGVGQSDWAVIEELLEPEPQQPQKVSARQEPLLCNYSGPSPTVQQTSIGCPLSILTVWYVQKASIKNADREDRWQSSLALQSVPADVLEKLHRYQDEADTANADLAVRP